MQLKNFTTLFLAVVMLVIGFVAEAQVPKKPKSRNSQVVTDQAVEPGDNYRDKKDMIDDTTLIETPASKPTAAPAVVVPPKDQEETAETWRPGRFGVGVLYSPIDLWIPSKKGLNLTYNASDNYSFELEYLSGSIGYSVFIVDLGKISDTRISGLVRSFNGRKSFNFMYGAYYQKFEVKLGDDFVSTVSSVPQSSIDAMTVETAGLTWGMGNRWQFNLFNFGVDWFVINIPVTTLYSNTDFIKYTDDETKKDQAEDVVKFFENFPTLATLKFQLGIAF